MRNINPNILIGDIPEALLKHALDQREVAWDIETSGLDWRSDHLATCQLAIAEEIYVVQHDRGETPQNLRKLLQASSTRKVFHHAPFDLRFMSYQWSAHPRNIACTKIAAKITLPGRPHESYSLKASLHSNLGVDIDKSARLSNWSSKNLTSDQKNYAANDVAYLLELLHVLESRAQKEGVEQLLAHSFEYLPARVELDLMGVQDVYSY